MSLDAVAVSAGYPGGCDVLTEVTVSVEPGTITGLTGPSGSGKTTLARVLALLQKPHTGTVLLDGTAVRGVGYSAPASSRAQIALLFQSPRQATDPRMTLRSIIEQPGVIVGRTVDVADLAEQVGLTADLLTRRPHQVSDGQLQRACVARALAQRPRYLICDEVTSMLDAATTASIARVLQRQAVDSGVGVLVISHDADLLDALCSSVHHLS
ncbi:ABC transporter ATP-binding protein [Rhodococcus sp. 05-340-1]|uniref:ABC transporter ATP-binding protein n=1 Tax=unclassified Rhodococcus (in: high G+C Gram-positive bacteria) TaxID=192944 RepID=UPI000B9B47EA|nr:MULTISPECIES: ATP-binding cassette domain-containing protein [unclassified Rhodococcus (in: high G+C Gram-positive bacteria)]OZD68515.1 ABC transporter ATP-binding protein [Rhodococcus sp. 05-340-2]OZD70093.1 ABC transporter ATP-binding protein [Rhodococcus sp. 05-340-1]